MTFDLVDIVPEGRDKYRVILNLKTRSEDRLITVRYEGKRHTDTQAVDKRTGKPWIEEAGGPEVTKAAQAFALREVVRTRAAIKAMRFNK